jgi:hypothetical protein
MSIQDSYHLLYAIEELIGAKIMDSKQSHEMGYESFRVDTARIELRAQLEILLGKSND